MGITTNNIWGAVKRALPCGDDDDQEGYQTAPGGFAPTWTAIPSWVRNSSSKGSKKSKKSCRMASSSSSGSYRTAPSSIPSSASSGRSYRTASENFYYSAASSRIPSQSSAGSFHTAKSHIPSARSSLASFHTAPSHISAASSEASFHTAHTHQSVDKEIRFPVRLGNGKNGWKSISQKSIPAINQLPSWRWMPRRKYPATGF
jgi:hypothetical protein